MKKKEQQSLKKAKKLVSLRFHNQVYVFGKKASEKILAKKVWDYVVKVKKRFMLRKEKVQPLSRKEREEICKFIKEQLRKEYIRTLKLLQIAPVFFVGKKDDKKLMVQDYRYLNIFTKLDL